MPPEVSKAAAATRITPFSDLNATATGQSHQSSRMTMHDGPIMCSWQAPHAAHSRAVPIPAMLAHLRTEISDASHSCLHQRTHTCSRGLRGCIAVFTTGNRR